MRKLICFTASYPYGSRETYFETELFYLAEKFDRIIILPLYNPYKNNRKREVPANVTVHCPLVPAGKAKIMKGLFSTAPLKPFFKDFISQKVYLSRYRFFKWFNFFLSYRASYFEVKEIVQENKGAILYAYWAEAPLFLAEFSKPYKKVVRMHGGDFYLNRNQGYLPLRQKIYDTANLLLPISKDIKNILQNHYKIASNKIYLNYLGTKNDFNALNLREYKEQDHIVIVSCSNLVPLKRVDLIVEALKLASNGVSIEWHHFGDGICMEDLKKQVKDLPISVKAFLHGWAAPSELKEFYNTHKITWFVNVSRYEGLPVSIMEAFSAAIPVIATDVGGTSEIVNDATGVLLPKNFEPKQLLEVLIKFDPYIHRKRSRMAYESWRKFFDAEINYARLTEKLMTL